MTVVERCDEWQVVTQQEVSDDNLIDTVVKSLSEQLVTEVRGRASGVTIKITPQNFPWGVNLSYKRDHMRFNELVPNDRERSGLCILREELIQLTGGVVSLWWMNSSESKGFNSGDIKTISLAANGAVRDNNSVDVDEWLDTVAAQMRVALDDILRKMSNESRVSFTLTEKIA